MERWAGKVAVVTGANSGNGKAMVTDLVKAGLIVVGLDIRHNNIDALKEQLKGEKGDLHAITCDITSEAAVIGVFNKIEKKFGSVNILVNNAGILVNSSILGPSSSMDKMARVIDTNINGVLYCTRAFDEILMRTGEEGHIINIGSLAGHRVPVPPPQATLNVYGATKSAINAITEVLRQELIVRNRKVRISVISPGVVRTELFATTGLENVDDLFKIALNPEDISQACLYILGTPPHVQVHDIIIRTVGQLS